MFPIQLWYLANYTARPGFEKISICGHAKHTTKSVKTGFTLVLSEIKKTPTAAVESYVSNLNISTADARGDQTKPAFFSELDIMYKLTIMISQMK